MTILDQMISHDSIQPKSVIEVFLLQLAKRLQDDRQSGWYMRYAPNDLTALLQAYRRVLNSPAAERAAKFRSLVLNKSEP